MIQTRDLAKSYQGKRPVEALRGITLTVAKGEMAAITGPSGCGKSTLLNIIGGLDRPTAGSLSIDGLELNGLDNDELARLRRRKVGFLFQSFNLLPTLTAADNVALPMRLAGMNAKVALKRSRELLEAVRLSERADHLPDELSGGEQQRVALARALALQPAVLLADEPTGNLDSDSAHRVLTLLTDVRREFGATVLMATHDPSSAGYCQRILHMRDGQLTCEGG